MVSDLHIVTFCHSYLVLFAHEMRATIFEKVVSPKLFHTETVVEVCVQLGGSGALDPGSHKIGKAVSHSVRYSDTLWYSLK